MAWQQPKTNWDTHPKAIEPADLNRIEGNIEVVRVNGDLPLRLEVVDSFPSHAPGRAIYHTGNKMAYVSDGNNWLTFAAPQFTKTYTPGTKDQIIEEGYHKNSVVKGDANLIAANIVAGKSIFGVVGSHWGVALEPSSTNIVHSFTQDIQLIADNEYHKIKEVQINRGSGRIYVAAEQFSPDGGANYIRVTRNGTVVMSDMRSGTRNIWVAVSGQVDISLGDRIAVHCRTSTEGAYLDYFRIGYNVVPQGGADKVLL
jgi:hypothetical protein